MTRKAAPQPENVSHISVLEAIIDQNQHFTVVKRNGAIVPARHGARAKLIAAQMIDEGEERVRRDDLDVVTGPGRLRP